MGEGYRTRRHQGGVTKPGPMSAKNLVRILLKPFDGLADMGGVIREVAQRTARGPAMAFGSRHRCVNVPTCDVPTTHRPHDRRSVSYSKRRRGCGCGASVASIMRRSLALSLSFCPMIGRMRPGNAQTLFSGISLGAALFDSRGRKGLHVRYFCKCTPVTNDDTGLSRSPRGVGNW
jgi:hypothetical protein